MIGRRVDGSQQGGRGCRDGEVESKLLGCLADFCGEEDIAGEGDGLGHLFLQILNRWSAHRCNTPGRKPQCVRGRIATARGGCTLSSGGIPDEGWRRKASV